MILLDTCILLRVAAEVTLPSFLRTALEQDPWAISAVSAWEIAIKHALGKLPLPQAPDRWWLRAVEVFRLTVIDLDPAIALKAGSLPPLHADSFDRGIIATALERNLTLASVDRMLAAYVPCGVRIVGVA